MEDIDGNFDGHENGEKIDDLKRKKNAGIAQRSGKSF